MNIERRKAERFKNGEIYFSFETGAVFLKKKSIILSSKDISKIGMAFIYEEPFSFDEKLSILLYLPMHTKPVKITGKVRKCEWLSEGQYKIGLEFTKIPAEVQQYLEPLAYFTYKPHPKKE